MRIDRIDHIAVNCIDIKKSLEFYEGILGLKLLEKVNCGDFDIHYLQLPEGARLELFDYRGKNRKTEYLESDSGLRHLAFQVQDVAAHEKQLRNCGVEITLPTCDLPDLRACVLLFLDPNGVTIEFCEILE